MEFDALSTGVQHTSHIIPAVYGYLAVLRSQANLLTNYKPFLWTPISLF